MPKTANELLLDATLRHQMQLLRYSKGEAARISRLLEQADKEILAKLQTDLTAFSEARLKAFLTEVRRAREQIAVRMKESLDKDLPDLALTEHDWEVGALNASSPVALSLAAVPASTLKAVAGSPINGVPLEGWLGQLVKSDVTKMEQAIRLGVVQGETLDQITKRVQGVADLTRRNAETITRTAVNHVSSAARQSVWEANSDILEGVKWVATLDGRTSDICASRDGEVYPVDSGPRPPAHPNCRSTISPVLKGEAIVGERPSVTDTRTRNAREVDFRADAKAKAGDGWKTMSKADRNDAIRAERQAWTKANVGTVPSNTTYDAWLRGQSKDFQDDVLGPGRAKLFRDGMTMDKFVDPQGKSYSLSELKAELSKDSLNVTQPGVGLKAKALLQQGYMADEVHHAILQEFPDAKTSMASIASYKSELKKLGVSTLDSNPHGIIQTLVSQSTTVGDIVSGLEAQLPAGVKYSLGGQWSTLVADLEGAPGAYGNYTAGKGVQLSVTKLSKLTPAQAQQVVAHELGHLLHKQHDIQLPDFVNDVLKASAKSLSPEGKKLYSYYLTHLDELTAEVYAQALSPSPLTSQGLLATEFKQVFGPAIDAAKQLLADKFPIPSSLAKPQLPGGPGLPFEVAGKHTSIGSLAKSLIQQGMPDEQVLVAIKAEFPGAKTGMNSIKSYKSELKKLGQLKSQGSGPVVTATKVAPVGNPIPASSVAASADDIIQALGVSPIQVGASQVKAYGLKLMQAGVLDNGDVVDALVKAFPKNKVTPAAVATWKSVWKKDNPLAFAEAISKKVKLSKKSLGAGPLKEPALAGKPMGQVSSNALKWAKTQIAGGETNTDELLKGIKQFFGSGAHDMGAKDILELAHYEVATGKAVAKPYMNAAMQYTPPSSSVSKVVVANEGQLEAAIDGLLEADGDIDFDSMMAKLKVDSGATHVDPKVLQSFLKAGELEDHGFAEDLMEEAVKVWQKAQKDGTLHPKIAPVDMTPSRLASSPVDSYPPPPRFSALQRAAGIREYGAAPNEALASTINARFGLKGEAALTAEEATAVKHYTGGSFRSLNHSLRHGEFTSRPALQAYVDAAQHGLGKLPKFNGLSSRGVTLDYVKLKDALATYRKGAVVEEHAFTSSSKGDSSAFGGNMIFKIQGKTGVDISSFSHYPGEREVLFMPGTRFRILDVAQVNGRYIVTAEEL